MIVTSFEIVEDNPQLTNIEDIPYELREKFANRLVEINKTIGIKLAELEEGKMYAIYIRGRSKDEIAAISFTGNQVRNFIKHYESTK